MLRSRRFVALASCSLLVIVGWTTSGCGPKCSSSGQATSTGRISVDGRVLDFDATEVFIRHSERDGDDACIFEVAVTFVKGPKLDGCNVRVGAASGVDGDGRLLVDHLSITKRDRFCPGWELATGMHAPTTSSPHGTIETTASVERGWVSFGNRTVSGACYRGDLILDVPSVTVGDAGEHTLELEPVSVSVSRNSIGALAACPRQES